MKHNARLTLLGAIGITCVGLAAHADQRPSNPLDPMYYRGHPGGESIFGDIADKARTAYSWTQKEFHEIASSAKSDHLTASPLGPSYFWRGPVTHAAADSKNYVDDENPLTPRYYTDHPFGQTG